MSDQTNDNNDDENKPMKIVFMEGCFDDFEGTQEELDELIAHITALAESGELLERSSPVDDEIAEQLEIVANAAAEYGYDENGLVKYPFAGNTRH